MWGWREGYHEVEYVGNYAAERNIRSGNEKRRNAEYE
jgi:hypothetical protein